MYLYNLYMHGEMCAKASHDVGSMRARVLVRRQSPELWGGGHKPQTTLAHAALIVVTWTMDYNSQGYFAPRVMRMRTRYELAQIPSAQ